MQRLVFVGLKCGACSHLVEVESRGRGCLIQAWQGMLEKSLVGILVGVTGSQRVLS